MEMRFAPRFCHLDVLEYANMKHLLYRLAEIAVTCLTSSLSISTALAATTEAGWSELSLRSLHKLAKSENMVFSPFGLTQALQLLVPACGPEELAKVNDILAPENTNVPKFMTAQFVSANSVWVKQDLVVKSDYLDTVKSKFQAEVESVDFAGKPDLTAKKINDWCSHQTQHLVTRIVEGKEIQHDMALLINAIYFKNSWSSYGPYSSLNHEFTNVSGKMATIPFVMSSTGERPYFKGDGIQLVELPMNGGDVVMGLIFPERDFVTWRDQLSATLIERWLKQAQPKKVLVKLPKLDIAANLDLKALLSSLGMEFMFENGNHFPGLSASPLKLSKVKQNARFKLNENGVEAAAVTSTGIFGGAMMESSQPIEVLADRPFLFYLAPADHRQILFLGQFMKP